MDKLLTVKSQHSFRLLTLDNVLGVAVGRRTIRGQTTDELCIKVYVEEKKARRELSEPHFIPPEIDGVPTDVEKLYGKQTAGSPPLFAQRQRPVPMGASIGHYRSSEAGTLGGWLLDEEAPDKPPYFDSCWHVIANYGDCKVGDPILQPAPADGGKYPEDVIGYLEKWCEVRMLSMSRNLSQVRRRLRELLDNGAEIPTNAIDCAVGRAVDWSVVEGKPFTSQNISDKELPIGDAVLKTGRTTGTTRGAVAATHVDLFIDYRTHGTALFVNSTIFK